MNKKETDDEKIKRLIDEKTDLLVEIISLRKETKELTAIIKERDIALAYTKGKMQTYVDKVKEFSRLVDLLEDKELKLDNSIEHRQSPLLRLAAWALKNKHTGDVYN